MYLPIILYVACIWLVCAIDAFIDALRIRSRSKKPDAWYFKIYHRTELVLYGAACLPVHFLFYFSIWWLFLLAFVTRLAWFDPLINWGLNKPIAFNGSGGGTSDTDKWENRLGIPTIYLRILYFGIYLVCVVLFVVYNRNIPVR